MPQTCYVYGCPSTKASGSCFSFPADDVRRKIWEDFCKNPKPLGDKKNTRPFICSLHFELKHFFGGYRSDRLIRASKPIPTLCPPSSQLSNEDEEESVDEQVKEILIVEPDRVRLDVVEGEVVINDTDEPYENLDSNQLSLIDSNLVDNEEFWNDTTKWDKVLTMSLISVRKQLDKRFLETDNKYKIISLWNEVHRTLINLNLTNPLCLHLTLTDTAIRWKQLLTTYHYNFVRCSKLNSRVVSWEYFQYIYPWMTYDVLIEISTISEIFENDRSHSHENKSANCQDVKCKDPADYHFAMVLMKELESLPTHYKTKKKQKILAAMFD